MRPLRAIGVAALATMLTACASAGTAGSAVQHNLVTAADLAPMHAENAYDALSRIRPAFFRSRDVQTWDHPNPVPVHVYVNGSKREGLDALRQIQADAVQEIRFYEPQDANTRFGTGNNGGVIAVTLKP